MSHSQCVVPPIHHDVQPRLARLVGLQPLALSTWCLPCQEETAEIGQGTGSHGHLTVLTHLSHHDDLLVFWPFQLTDQLVNAAPELI